MNLIFLPQGKPTKNTRSKPKMTATQLRHSATTKPRRSDKRSTLKQQRISREDVFWDLVNDVFLCGCNEGWNWDDLHDRQSDRHQPSDSQSSTNSRAESADLFVKVPSGVTTRDILDFWKKKTFAICGGHDSTRDKTTTDTDKTTNTDTDRNKQGKQGGNGHSPIDGDEEDADTIDTDTDTDTDVNDDEDIDDRGDTQELDNSHAKKPQEEQATSSDES